MLEVDSEMTSGLGGIGVEDSTEAFFSIKALVVKTEDAVAGDEFLPDDTNENIRVAIVLDHLQRFLHVPSKVRTTLR